VLDEAVVDEGDGVAGVREHARQSLNGKFVVSTTLHTSDGVCDIRRRCSRPIWAISRERRSRGSATQGRIGSSATSVAEARRLEAGCAS
jgi:hypothetical protein